jgi:hypothetical protein
LSQEIKLANFDDSLFVDSIPVTLQGLNGISVKLKVTLGKSTLRAFKEFTDSFRKDRELFKLSPRLKLSESRYGTIFDQSPLSIQSCLEEAVGDHRRHQ